MGDEAAAAAPAPAGGAGTEEKVIHTYPLVRHSDMPEEMRMDAIEVTQTACEKYAQNNELAARMVKELMDKKYGPSFHVVVEINTTIAEGEGPSKPTLYADEYAYLYTQITSHIDITSL